MHEQPQGTAAAERASAAEPGPEASPGWDRLNDQLAWYERRGRQNKLWYLGLKVAQIVVAASIPVVAAAGASAAVAGGLGALVVVLEGLQQLFQFQQSWVGYRGTAEALARERSLYLASVGPYEPSGRREATLAERVEQILAQERDSWTELQRQTTAGGSTEGRQ